MGKKKKEQATVKNKTVVSSAKTLAEDVFERNQSADVIFIADDNQAFLSEHHCKNHCNAANIDYVKIRRDENLVVEQTEEKNEENGNV